MAMPRRTKRTERFTIRIDPSAKKLIEDAAEAEMRSTGDFIRTVVVPAARRVLASSPEQVGVSGL
jgi:uncharacterized protein (DUF1778 family)